MEFTEQRHGAVSVVQPDGALTEADADGFRARMNEAISGSMGRLVLDAGEIVYVDSAGLEALLDVSEKLGESGRVLKLTRVNETLREVFDLTQTTGSFECFDDVNAAVRSFL
ncbi:MAG: STAS domain-containing protein [Phycisphaerales bacterium]|nr:STAS domain-containing protein [Phycisphaerales bacterium]